MILTHPSPTSLRSCSNGVASHGECVPFIFDTSEGIIESGAYAEGRITVQGLVQVGEVIEVGTVGSTYVSIENDDNVDENTDMLANLTGTNFENATRLASALASRTELKDAHITIEPNGSAYDVVIKFLRKGFYLEDIIVPTPYIAVIQNLGIGVEFEEGYGLAYQAYTEDAAGSPLQIFPKFGSFEPIKPTVNANQLFAPLSINLETLLGCLTSVQLPVCGSPTIELLPNSRKRFWIKYAKTKRVNCNSVFVGLKESGKEWVYHMQLTQFDAGGLCKYAHNGRNANLDLNQWRFLTRRSSWCLSREQCDWLAIILDAQDAEGITTPYAVVYSYTINGRDYIGVRSVTINEDGVYSIPSGANQIGGIPLSATGYKIEVQIGGQIISTATFKIDKCKHDYTVYFLNDLGWWDSLCFTKVSVRTIETDISYLCAKSDCNLRQYTTGFSEFSRASNQKAVKVKGMEQISIQTEYADNSPEIEKLIRAFAKSPQMYVAEMVENPTGQNADMIQVFRSVFIKSGETVLKESDGRIRLSIDLFYSKS